MAVSPKGYGRLSRYCERMVVRARDTYILVAVSEIFHETDSTCSVAGYPMPTLCHKAEATDVVVHLPVPHVAFIQCVLPNKVTGRT